MDMTFRLIACCLLLSLAPFCASAAAELHITKDMVTAAQQFIASLSAKQKNKAVSTFNAKAREEWSYWPLTRPKRYLTLNELNTEQRELIKTLLASGLSQKGLLKAEQIMLLEKVLFEQDNWWVRNPDYYYLAIFGTPSTNQNWGWKFEGHHLSINITLVDGQAIASAPRFLGANPAHITQGDNAGLRVLAAEEDLARQLLQSLTAAQRKSAIFREKAYAEIITESKSSVTPLDKAGIAAADLNAAQQDLLLTLISEYANTLQPALAKQKIAQVKTAGMDTLYFAWAGPTEKDKPHYYRIQSEHFLIEYDNTQNNANHIHTVWREFAGDFGRDLLKEHYSAHHQSQSSASH